MSYIEEAKRVFPKSLFDSVQQAIQKYREKLLKAAEKHGIPVELLEEEIRRRVLVAYKRALIEPGEPIGTVTAQSLGEPTTQMVLRTFHFAGIAKLNVTLGIPRMREIIEASKDIKTPIMEVYLKKEYYAKGLEYAEKEAKKVLTKIEKISLDRLSEAKEEKIDVDVEIGKKRFPMVGILEVTIKESILKDRGIKVSELVKLIKRIQSVQKVEIDDSLPEAVKLRIYIVPKDKGKALRMDRILDEIEKVYTYRLSGIDKVTRGLIEERKGEYVIRFEGSNINEVMKIPEVDETRVTTNDIKEIRNVLGIEAARNAIIHELRYTMKESGNLYVDVRHYMLLADAMTRYGEVLGAHRTSLLKHIKKSPIGKAAFETPSRFLSEAAKRGEIDVLLGVNESIIVGNLLKLGTGRVETKFDLFKIAKFKEEPEGEKE